MARSECSGGCTHDRHRLWQGQVLLRAVDAGQLEVLKFLMEEVRPSRSEIHFLEALHRSSYTGLTAEQGSNVTLHRCLLYLGLEQHPVELPPVLHDLAEQLRARRMALIICCACRRTQPQLPPALVRHTHCISSGLGLAA